MIQHVLPRTPTTPDAEAVRAGDDTRTWSELERRANAVARALRASGLRPDDRWAILAGNRVEWAELSLGNVRAGTHYVPLNWHLTASELTYMLDNSEAALVVVDPDYRDVVVEAAAAARIERVLTLGDDYERWIGAVPDEPTDDGPAGTVLLYTGGTTGRSKGVLRADRAEAVSSWATQVAGWGRLVGIPANGTCLISTPVYHAFGGAALGAALALGNRVVLEPRFDAERWLGAVEHERVTTAPLVPTQMIRLAKLDHAARQRHDVSSLQHVCHTAAPCPPWAKRELIEWWGPIIVEFYGSSEGTGPVVSTSEEWLAHPGTIGRPRGGLSASVVGEDGQDLPPGEIGTLYFKRTDGVPVYHGDADKTASMQLPDGRFTVGDVGWIDPEGYLYLADRRVDLILSGGVNIYPAEVEGVLIRHPAVRDAAVFGIPDPDWGQQVKAVVELQAPASEQELIDWCRAELASFKCPKTIDVHAELPREASGKLKKRLLRDPYWPDSAP